MAETNDQQKEKLRSEFRCFLKEIADDILIKDLEALKSLTKDKKGYGMAELEKITTVWQFFDRMERNRDLLPDNLAYLKKMLESIHRKDLCKKVLDFEDKHRAIKTAQETLDGAAAASEQCVSRAREQTKPKTLMSVVDADSSEQCGSLDTDLRTQGTQITNEIATVKRSTSQSIENRKQKLLKCVVDSDARSKWRPLGRELGIKDYDLTTIAEDYPRNLQEQCYQMLALWEQKTGGDLQIETLKEALKNNGLTAVAEKLSDFSS